jgi:hypothetical protein
MRKGWTAFHAAHARPYIVFADLLETRRRQTRFDLLGSLADALLLKGDYALMPEKDVIRIVIETEPDARKFADAVQARPAAREGGWGGQAAFIMDDVMEEKIRATLPPAPPRRWSGKAA